MSLWSRIALLWLFSVSGLTACGTLIAGAPAPTSTSTTPAATTTPELEPPSGPTTGLVIPDTFPPDARIAGVAVGGLNEPEAALKLENHFADLWEPIELHADALRYLLDPAEIDLRIPIDDLVQTAREQQQASTAISVPFAIDYNETVLRALLTDLAAEASTAPTLAPVTLTDTLSISFAYTPGQTLDIDDAVDEIDAMLRTPEQTDARRIVLPLTDDPQAAPPSPTFDELRSEIEALAATWDGVVGFYLHDLQSDETITLNAETVFSGASVIKVAILLHAYINLTEFDAETQAAIEAMIVESDNLSSNDVLAAAVGGSDTDDSYTSALSMTATLRELGLEHTYMTMPYESSEYLEGLRGIAIQRGPAQEGPPPYTAPDPVLRTTPAEIARLFLLIDQCSQGGGELLERFDTLSPARCQEMLDLLARNGDQSRMRARLPAETRVEHKSGWVSDMQADVGIVRSPGGDFLLAIYLWYDTDYMYDSEFIPTLAALAHLTYTAYNPINLSEPAAGTAPATSPETASDAQGDAEAAHNAATNLAESNDLDEPDEPDEPAP